MKPKRTYKDSLFRDIFNDKRRLQRIYHALTGKLIPLNEIKITTLRGTFFEDIKNDISFMAGNDFIILMEHQSTLSENLPLRMLCLFLMEGYNVKCRIMTLRLYILKMQQRY